MRQTVFGVGIGDMGFLLLSNGVPERGHIGLLFVGVSEAHREQRRAVQRVLLVLRQDCIDFGKDVASGLCQVAVSPTGHHSFSSVSLWVVIMGCILVIFIESTFT